MPIEAANLFVKIGADTTSMDRGLYGVTKSIGGFGNVLSTVVDVGMAAFAGGVAAVGGELVLATKAAGEAQTIQTQLNTVLKSTGGVAGMTADAINDLGKEYGNTTRFEDDAIVSAENLLLTFTKIGRDVFPDATAAVLDMSQGLGQDLKSSALQLGKALNDPVAGVTALKKAGVSLTEEQAEQVKSFMAVNDIASAQKVIINELAVEFGGRAVAAGKDFEGQMIILKNTLGNVQETIGDKMLPSLTKLASKFIELLQSEKVQALIDKIAVSFGELAQKITDNAMPAMDGIIDSISDAIDFIKNLNPEVVKATLAIAAFTVVMIPAIDAVIKINQAITLLKNVIPILSQVSLGGTGVATAFGAIAVPVGAAVAAILVMNKVSKDINDTNAITKKRIEEVAAAMTKEGQSIDAIALALKNMPVEKPWWMLPEAVKTSEQIAETIAKQARNYDELSTAIAGAGINLAVQQTNMGGYTAVMITHEEELQRLWDKVHMNDTEMRYFGQTAEYAKAVTSDLTTTTKELTDAQNDSAFAAQQVKFENELLSAAISGPIGEGMANFRQSFRDLDAEFKTAIKNYADGKISTEDMEATVSRLNKTISDQSDALKRSSTEFIFNKASQNLTAEAAMDLGRALGVVDEQSYAVVAAIETLNYKYDANRDGTIDAAEAQSGYTDKINELKLKVDDLENKQLDITINDLKPIMGDIDIFEGRIQAIPDKLAQITTVADLSGVQEAQHALDGLSDRTITVTTIYREEHGRASGGPVYAGESYIVGENGPEPFIPKTDGYIISNEIFKQSAIGNQGKTTTLSRGGGQPSSNDLSQLVSLLGGMKSPSARDIGREVAKSLMQAGAIG